MQASVLDGFAFDVGRMVNSDETSGTGSKFFFCRITVSALRSKSFPRLTSRSRFRLPEWKLPEPAI